MQSRLACLPRAWLRGTEGSVGRCRLGGSQGLTVAPSPPPGVNFDPDHCSPNGTDPYKPKCPESDSTRQAPAFPEWLTVTLLCLYLLFTNILLLNLLIAMFK